MYTPTKFEDLDQVSCWEYIFGRTVEVGKSHLYCSPIRGDNHPGCYLRWYKGVLWLMDFADHNYNCVEAWMKIKSLNYWDAIKDLSKGRRVNNSMTIKKEEPLIDICEKIITIRSYWRKEHEEYWNLRGLSRPNRVYGVISYTIEDKCYKKTYIPEDLCFAYKYDEGKYKIYFPNRPKPRFLGNLKSDDVWWSLRGSDTLFITKSHKDFLEAESLESLLEWDITHLQSEGIRTVPLEWETYKMAYINLDSDRVGLECTQKIINGLLTQKQVVIIPNQKSLEFITEDIIKYLGNNLANLYQCGLRTGILSMPFLDYCEGKDLDELITRNTNYNEIFKWILK